MKRLLHPHFIALGALMIIPLIFVPIPEYMDYFYQPKVFGMLFFSLMYLLFIFKERNDIQRYIHPDPINKALLVYFTLLSVSLFFAENINLSMQGEFLRYEGFSTLMLYFLLFLAARQADYNKIIATPILITLSIVSLYGILQHYGIDPFPRDILRLNWQVAFSTMGNQNFLGTYLVLMIPLSLHFALQKNNWISAVPYGISFYCLLAARTNSALVGITLGIFTYLLMTKYCRFDLAVSKKRLLFILAVTLSLFIIFNYQTSNSTLGEIKSMKTDFDTILQKKDNYQQAGSNRLFIWVRVLDLVKQRPFFGYGIENLGPVMERVYHDDIIAFWGKSFYIDKTHNEYLHIAVTSGIPAVLAYLMFIGLTIKHGFVLSKTNQSIIPILSGIIGYLSQAFFNISVVSVAYVFWIFLGFLASTHPFAIKFHNAHE